MSQSDLLSDFHHARTNGDYVSILTGIGDFSYVLPQEASNPVAYASIIVASAATCNNDVLRKMRAIIEKPDSVYPETGSPYDREIEIFRVLTNILLAGKDPEIVAQTEPVPGFGRAVKALMRLLKGVSSGEYGHYTLKMRYPASQGRVTFSKDNDILAQGHEGVSSRTLPGAMNVMCDVSAAALPINRLLKARIGENSRFIEELWQADSAWRLFDEPGWFSTRLAAIVADIDNASVRDVNADAASVFFPVGAGFHCITPVYSGHTQEKLRGIIFEKAEPDAPVRFIRKLMTEIPKPQNCGDFCNSIGGRPVHLLGRLPVLRHYSGYDAYLMGGRRPAANLYSLGNVEFRVLGLLPGMERQIVSDGFLKWPSDARRQYLKKAREAIDILTEAFCSDFVEFLDEFRIKNKGWVCPENHSLSAGSKSILDSLAENENQDALDTLFQAVCREIRRYSAKNAQGSRSCALAEGPFSDILKQSVTSFFAKVQS